MHPQTYDKCIIITPLHSFVTHSVAAVAKRPLDTNIPFRHAIYRAQLRVSITSYHIKLILLIMLRFNHRIRILIIVSV